MILGDHPQAGRLQEGNKMWYKSRISPYRLCNTQNIKVAINVYPFNWRLDFQRSVAWAHLWIGCVRVDFEW